MSDTLAAPSPATRLRDGVRFCLAVFVIMRVALSLLSVWGVRDNVPRPGEDGAAPIPFFPATAGWHNAVDGMARWDAEWFVRIAQDGYRTDDASAAFFPGYPALVHVVDVILPIGTLGSALLVANAAFLAALIVIFRLTTLEYDEATARRAIVLLACFPSSFFFLAPYSESLFLLSVSLCFLWARTGRWAAVAAAGFAAAATRSIGFAITPALLPIAWRDERRRRAIVASLAPLLAPLLYGLWWYEKVGNAVEPIRVQDSWHRTLQIPLVTLGRALTLGLEGLWNPTGLYWTSDLVLSLLVLVPLVLWWRALRPPYLVFVILGVLIPLSYPLPGRPLLSLPRFLVVLFPVFWAIAKRAGRRMWVTLAIAFVAGQAGLALAFMNWRFVF